MSFSDYANHVAQKCRVAIAISVIKTKPPDVSMEAYIDKLREGFKHTNVNEAEDDFSVNSEDFKMDTTLENVDRNNDDNRIIANSHDTIVQSPFINQIVPDECMENNHYDKNYKHTLSPTCTQHFDKNLCNALDAASNTNFVHNQNVLENATNYDVFNNIDMSDVTREHVTKGVDKNAQNIEKISTIENSQSILQEDIEFDINVDNFNDTTNGGKISLNSTGNIKFIKKDSSILTKCVEKCTPNANRTVTGKNREILDLNKNTDVNILSITNDMQSIINMTTITQISTNDANNKLFNDTQKPNRTGGLDVNNCDDNNIGNNNREISTRSFISTLKNSHNIDTTKNLIENAHKLKLRGENSYEVDEIIDLIEDDDLDETFCSDATNNDQTEIYTVPSNIREYCENTNTEEGAKPKSATKTLRDVRMNKKCKTNEKYPKTQDTILETQETILETQETILETQETIQETILEKKPSQEASNYNLRCSLDTMFENSQVMNQKDSCDQIFNHPDSLTQCNTDIIENSETDLNLNKQIVLKYPHIDNSNNVIANNRNIRILEMIPIKKGDIREVVGTKTGITKITRNMLNEPNNHERDTRNECLKKNSKPGNINFSENDTFQFVHTQEKSNLKENVNNEIHGQHFCTNNENYEHQIMRKTNFENMQIDKDLVHPSTSENVENMLVDEDFQNVPENINLKNTQTVQNFENMATNSDYHDTPSDPNFESTPTNADLVRPVDENLQTIPHIIGANFQPMELENCSSDDDLDTENTIPFKVIEELSRARRYISAKEQKITILSSDSGYKSSDHQTSSETQDVQLEQCGLTLFKSLLDYHFTENNCSIIDEISKVLGSLIDHLHTEESYPDFLSHILDKINCVFEGMFDKDNVEMQSKDELLSLFLSLNYSTNILSSTVEKFNAYLEKFHVALTSGEDLMEIQNVQKLENHCYMFHILEIILKRYKSLKASDMKSSQNTVISKTRVVEMWRKKWDPHFRETDFLVSDTQDCCFLEDCREILKKIIVDSIDGYSLVSYAALQCYNHLQD